MDKIIVSGRRSGSRTPGSAWRRPRSNRRKAPATASRAARQQRRRDRSRDEILVAARKVLLENGVGAMTLDAVAREAGMSKTGLYYYFPSKDALVFELVYATLEESAAAVHDAVEKAEDGGDALRAIVRETVQRLRPRLDDFRLAFLFGQVARAGAVQLGRRAVRAPSPAQRPHLRRRRRPATRGGRRAGRAAAAGVPRLSRGDRAPHDEGHGRARTTRSSIPTRN